MIAHQNSQEIAHVGREEGVGTVLWWRKTLLNFLGVFLLKCWLTFSKHSPNKQISLFFGPPENQQAKYLEYSHETISIFNTLDWSTFVWMDLLLPFDSHCFHCALLLGSHWLSQVLPPVTILWRNASGSWSYLFKISMDCSGVVCGWSG